MTEFIVGAEQQDLALTCASLERSDEVCATNSGDIVFKPLHGVAESVPHILNIGCCAPERLGNKDIALADGSGKPLDMRLKTMLQDLIVMGHVRSGRYTGGCGDRWLQFLQ